MDLFHSHVFLQSNEPLTIYCMCGKTKDLHRHEFEEIEAIADKSNGSKRLVGYVLKCKMCGILTNHFIYD